MVSELNGKSLIPELYPGYRLCRGHFKMRRKARERTEKGRKRRKRDKVSRLLEILESTGKHGKSLENSDGWWNGVHSRSVRRERKRVAVETIERVVIK